jgi:hypothetical protein
MIQNFFVKKTEIEKIAESFTINAKAIREKYFNE